MDELQKDLSTITPILLDSEYKSPKVKKMLAVLESHGVLRSGGEALDVGCSAGFFCGGLAQHFEKVWGIDIDAGALELAESRNVESNVEFKLIDDDCIPFPDQVFDLVVCNHVYEHVPSSEFLIEEIQRVLKPGGVCYFGAASKYVVIEPHFKLPFLSWLPKFIAHRYMRVFGKGDYYYEKLRSYGGIMRLVGDFEVVDYTVPVIKNPRKYCAEDMIKEGGVLSNTPSWILELLKPLMPSFILLLRKR